MASFASNAVVFRNQFDDLDDQKTVTQSAQPTGLAGSITPGAVEQLLEYEFEASDFDEVGLDEVAFLTPVLSKIV